MMLLGMNDCATAWVRRRGREMGRDQWTRHGIEKCVWVERDGVRCVVMEAGGVRLRRGDLVAKGEVALEILGEGDATEAYVRAALSPDVFLGERVVDAGTGIGTGQHYEAWGK